MDYQKQKEEFEQLISKVECIYPNDLDEKLGYTKMNNYSEYKKNHPPSQNPTTYWKNNVCIFSDFGNQVWFHYYAIWRTFEKKYSMSDSEIANLLGKRVLEILKEEYVVVCVNKSGMHIGDSCQPDDYEKELTLRAKLGTLIFKSNKILKTN